MDDTKLDFGERLKQKRGRDARDQSLATRFTKAEEDELAKAAEGCGKTLREWTREVLLREARRMKDDALFTEVVSIKLLLVNFLRPIAMGQKITLEQVTDIQATIRKGKRKAAQEIMQQYTARQEKE